MALGADKNSGIENLSMDMGPAVTPKFTSSALTPLIAVKIRRTYEVRGPVASLPRTAAEAPWMLETQQLQELRHVGNWIGLLAEEGRGELQTPLLESATSAVPAPSFLQTLTSQAPDYKFRLSRALSPDFCHALASSSLRYLTIPIEGFRHPQLESTFSCMMLAPCKWHKKFERFVWGRVINIYVTETGMSVNP